MPKPILLYTLIWNSVFLLLSDYVRAEPSVVDVCKLPVSCTPKCDQPCVYRSTESSVFQRTFNKIPFDLDYPADACNTNKTAVMNESSLRALGIKVPAEQKDQKEFPARTIGFNYLKWVEKIKTVDTCRSSDFLPLANTEYEYECTPTGRRIMKTGSSRRVKGSKYDEQEMPVEMEGVRFTTGKPLKSSGTLRSWSGLLLAQSESNASHARETIELKDGDLDKIQFIVGKIYSGSLLSQRTEPGKPPVKTLINATVSISGFEKIDWKGEPQVAIKINTTRLNQDAGKLKLTADFLYLPKVHEFYKVTMASTQMKTPIICTLKNIKSLKK